MKCRCHSHNGLVLISRGVATPREVAQQFSLEGLAPRGVLEYVDSMGSVSSPEPERDLYANLLDSDIDEQERRFHRGS